jgi:uncharacterized membrane protein SpoIIM required for sporulation
VKEITFLKQHSKKWEGYEEQLKAPDAIAPAELTDMFIELTDDLSYAQSHYKHSNSTIYLNNLTSKIHQQVYKNKKESSNRFITFWTKELPSLFGYHHKALLWSFIIMVLATALGVISQLVDDDFVRLILGDYYVDLTIERIKNGNALGIYGENNQFEMFVFITLNNIRVSFVAFVCGILTAFGTAFFLMYNGIMLGSFFAMFYKYNVLNEALKVVWIHGTLEISAIVIAGCAGIVLGNSLVFPKTYTRMQSFVTGAKSGIKIIIGLIPVFIAAGFLESFVTRYTRMPLVTALVIILGSLLFIITYFIILPIYLKRKSNT